MFKRIVSLFLLITLVGQYSFAEESPHFQPVKAGDVVAYDGYLFSPAAIAKVISKNEEDKSKLKLDYENKLVLAEIENAKVMELISAERAVQAKLLNDTIANKDRLIDTKVKELKDLETSITVHRIAIVGSFIGGILLTTTLFIYTSGMNK